MTAGAAPARIPGALWNDIAPLVGDGPLTYVILLRHPG